LQTDEIGVGHKNETEKITSIAEILGILDETHRSKDWLLAQIKKHKVVTSAKSSMNSFEILKSCPDDFISSLLRVLKGEDIEGLEDLHTLTRTYHWFFTDIVASANPKIPTKNQVKKIIVLNEFISRTEIFRNRDPKATIILPTGDGMAIGFGDSPEKPLRMAVELHRSLSRYNQDKRGDDKLLIRIGIDMGPVYFIKDLNGQDNVWGPGIILTRRVMDLALEMQILASANIAENIRKLSPEYKAITHPIGDYSIKHGEQLVIYNVYGDGFGNRVAPRKSKIAGKNLQQEIKTVNNFAFDSIDIILEITDLKTWATHHTWIWKIQNVSKEPKEQIFYYLDGDTQKDFASMNVTVKDDRDNKLQILAISRNLPYHKEFNVQLGRPLKQKQKKSIKLEYDWEEPLRTFFYRFASNCKRFSYTCIIPKGVELKNRVLKVEVETGYKVHATPPPTIEYKDDKTTITWQKNNLKAYEAYQFEW